MRLAVRNAVMLSCLVLGACAPTIWDKPGATQADFNQESAQCRLLARGMNSGGFYAQGSPSFVAGAALNNALGTAANQVATYRDCMMALGYTPQELGAATGEAAPPAPVGRSIRARYRPLLRKLNGPKSVVFYERLSMGDKPLKYRSLTSPADVEKA